jgi:hypothetical protein
VAKQFASFSPGYQRGVLQAMDDELPVKRSQKVVVGVTLNNKPHQSWAFVPDVVKTYEIPDFGMALRRYLAESNKAVDAMSGESNLRTYPTGTWC